ncbi:hypothetical protein KQY30_27950 [Streptomyces sp. GMY02]|uniref:CU044_2847 family protein n=1 Tax=Streptomyces sp. GMY02 TaxID=1333528 RepID=UPI001C2BE5CE|nr:CU044_2847 family protein [Streptomyces sp. GMY02]QXE37489.1 hypothetical protein KQY30_27950 [Streptomyces sp. GMY02]
MGDLVRMPLEGGGSVLFEAAASSAAQGPVKVARPADVVRDLPRSLLASLAPVRETARSVLDQLRQAGPDEVEIEFGVDLSAEAGAVITKTQGAFHLKVRVLWSAGSDLGAGPAPVAGGGTERGVGSGLVAGGGADPGAGADPGVGTGPGVGLGSDPGAAADPGVGRGPDPGPDPRPGAAGGPGPVGGSG